MKALVFVVSKGRSMPILEIELSCPDCGGKLKCWSDSINDKYFICEECGATHEMIVGWVEVDVRKGVAA